MSNYFNKVPNLDYVSRLPDANISDYIPVKKCAIIYEGNAIKKIRLFIRVENNLFTSVKIIDLFPSNTYSYYHTQQVRGLKKQVLFIKTIR